MLGVPINGQWIIPKGFSGRPNHTTIEVSVVWNRKATSDIITTIARNVSEAIVLYKTRLKKKIEKWGSVDIGGGLRLRINHSLPGNAPLQQTGNLYNSITTKTGIGDNMILSSNLGIMTKDSDVIEGVCYTMVPYAAALEFGGAIQTDEHNKLFTNYRLINPIRKVITIAPRPVWIVVWWDSLQKMLNIVSKRRY